MAETDTAGAAAPFPARAGAPRCSIIMPAFNVAEYIGEAVDSVLAQEMGDWELIVVDDGSTDETVDIVAELQHPQIRFLFQENQGVSAARNRGIRETRGDYVLFLDADDRLRPDALRRLIEALEAQPDAVVAYGEAVVMDAEGNVYGTGKAPMFTKRPSGDVTAPLLGGNFIVTPGVLLARRSVLNRAGGFSEDLSVAEDWELWCRLSLVGHFVYVPPPAVLEYRIRPRSAARTLGMETVSAARSVRAVYLNPIILERCGRKELLRLRRRGEASILSFVANQHLRNGSWRTARRFLRASLRRRMLRPRETVLLGLAHIHWIPGFIWRRLK